ncbi:MAG TPA: hypothetical protein VNO87_08775 [Methylomirabilota bacterium]|nr:hypothetical protein [Methylomirabilota bacterium]
MRNDGGRAVAYRRQKTQAVHLPRLPPLGGEQREREAAVSPTASPIDRMGKPREGRLPGV